MNPSKYKAKKSECDGIVFDSKAEMEYYELLKTRKERGDIVDFKLQPSYVVQKSFETEYGDKIRPIIYKADFEIQHYADIWDVVDVKGMPSPVSLIKRKLFLNCREFQHIRLMWVIKSKKWGDKDGWIDYFELQKIRRKNKKKS